jgi:hypothetical protein
VLTQKTTNNKQMGSSTSSFCETIKIVTKHEDDPEIGNAKADAYANLVGMDNRNREAMKVLINGTTEDFIKHVHTGDNGEQLSYAEMRARYG